MYPKIDPNTEKQKFHDLYNSLTTGLNKSYCMEHGAFKNETLKCNGSKSCKFLEYQKLFGYTHQEMDAKYSYFCSRCKMRWQNLKQQKCPHCHANWQQATIKCETHGALDKSIPSMFTCCAEGCVESLQRKCKICKQWVFAANFAKRMFNNNW